jgi:hypothetical protein
VGDKIDPPDLAEDDDDDWVEIKWKYPAPPDLMDPPVQPDEEFPEDEGSYGDTSKLRSLADKCTGWASSAKLVKCSNNQPTLFGTINVTDIKQGGIGDCWWIAAISGIAERPELVKACFHETEVSANGVYHVRLFEPTEDYEEVEVEVNDHVPVRNYYSNSDKCKMPCLAQSLNGELYTMLLEKALAKHLGSLSELSGGWTFLGYTYLVGCRQHTVISVKDGSLQHNEVIPEKLGRRSGPQKVVGEIDPDDAWALLVKGEQDGALMCCSWDGAGLEAIADDTGLVSGHAYTMIQALESPDGFHLMQCRNPWGSDMEWGKENPESCEWCDESPLWGQYPETAKACGYNGPRPDGIFWIPWDLFQQYGKSAVISWLPGTGPDEE